MSVAVGFSAYLQDLSDNIFGFHLPAGDRVSDVSRDRPAGRSFQYPSATDHHGRHLGAGARREGKREREHGDGDDQDRGDPVLLYRRREGDQHCNYHPYRAERILRHPDRRVDRVLHLYRLRFNFDRGGRVQTAAARSAIRHYRDADHLHHSLRRSGASSSPASQLENAGS